MKQKCIYLTFCICARDKTYKNMRILVKLFKPSRNSTQAELIRAERLFKLSIIIFYHAGSRAQLPRLGSGHCHHYHLVPRPPKLSVENLTHLIFRQLNLFFLQLFCKGMYFVRYNSLIVWINFHIITFIDKVFYRL